MENNSKKSDLLYQIIYDATRDKFSILPILAGLMLALISFGVTGGLFRLTITIRSVITILLLLMILSIQIYYSETISLLTIAQDKFDDHYGKTRSNSALTFTGAIKYLITGKAGDIKKEDDFFDRFSSQFPALAILILWLVVFLLIFEVWSGIF
jgi:hypothetical protein